MKMYSESVANGTVVNHLNPPQTYVAGLLNTLAVPVTYKTTSRIGREDSEKRQLKLVMSNEKRPSIEPIV